MKPFKPLNPCPMCKTEVTIEYLERGRYRVYCDHCGQYFEFNAPSALAAELIYNYIIAKKGD